MEPQITKFLSGGLNLLAAGDAVPEGQCLAAQNWRTDQVGRLRSRKSNSAAVFTSGVKVHSMLTALRATGPQRYFGVDGSVFRGALQVGTGLTGDPLGMVSFQDRVWIMNPNGQAKDDGTNYFNWTPIAPITGPNHSAGGAATGGLNGDYSYYVTGVTDEGEETNPSPAASVTGLGANDSVILTKPAFPDAQITLWNVYRQGGSFPLQAYKVNSAPLAVASATYVDLGTTPGTYGDDQTDLGLAALGVTLPTDHTAAPAARGLAGPYFGKLLAFNSVAHANRIWWTPSEEPYYFPGAASNLDGNWVDVGERGEQIVAIAVWPRQVVILKEKTYYRLVGDPDDWGSEIERTNVEVGQIGPKAWAVSGSTVYGQATEGVYLASSDAAQKASTALDPIFKQDQMAPGAIPAVTINASATVRAAACMAYRRGRLYFSYPSALSAGGNDTTVVLDGGQWYSDSRAFTALYDEGEGGALLGAIGGSVYELESGSAEANIALTYQSRYEDQGAPENEKRYSDILIEHNTGGRTFTAYAYLNNGDTVRVLGTFKSSTRTQTTFTLDTIEYRNISIRLECLTGNALAEIYTVVLHYLPLERNARTYDTGKIPLDKVSLLGALEVDLEILSGSVTYTFSAGITGLAELESGSFQGTEHTFTAQLPDGTEARWVRLVLTGDNFRCKGARLQIQPYGCYLAGVGDIFRSGDLTFGSPRTKLVQQLRIGCAPDGAIPGQFYTDQPGSAMAARQALALVATVGRTWQRQTFPINTRGRVCRVELTAPAVCRLYEIQARVKILGEPGGWQWVDVPVPATPEGFSWMPLPIT